MTATSAPPTLEYAALPDPRERRRQVVLRVAAVAALILSVSPSLHLGTLVYALAVDLVGVWDLSLLLNSIYMCAGPAMLAAAFLAWRAVGRSERDDHWVRRAFLLAFLLATIPLGVHLFVLPGGSSPWWDLRHAVQSQFLFLLIPLMLNSSLLSQRRWRERAMLLAAATLSLHGIGGLAYVVQESMRVERIREIPLADAMRVVIQRPMPVVGLWPFLGFIAAGVLLASLNTRNRVPIRIAVAAGFVFTLLMTLVNNQWFVGWGGGFWLSLNRAQVFLLASDRLLGNTLPLGLLWWATREAAPDETATNDVLPEAGIG